MAMKDAGPAERGLFDAAAEREAETNAPLAERMRPRDLSEVVGHDEPGGGPSQRLVAINLFEY